MSTVAERPTSTNGRPRLNREQASEELLKVLTNEPQSAAELRRRVLGHERRGRTGDVIGSGLGVLEARHQAKRIPRAPGQRGGWVLAESKHDAAIVMGEEINFPYEWALLNVEDLFIDETYQRPLTSFVEKIMANFDPVLFQTLAVNQRKTGKKKLAIIDGQTRWMAARRKGIRQVPCILFRGLTPEQEADMFARLQKERRGMISWHRFRAQLRAGKPVQVAIAQIVTMVGYELGDAPNQLKAVAALEHCYQRDPDLLERTLSDLHDAFGEEIPEGFHVKGLHYLFRHFPIDKKKREEIEDPLLVRRFRASSLSTLKRKMLLVKEAGTVKGGNDKFMAVAMQNVYTGGGRST